MNYKVKYNSWVFQLPMLYDYDGICIGRTIHVRFSPEATSPTLLRHEAVHQEQMDRHGVLGFYAIYAKDFVVNLFKFKLDWKKAYLNIPFEIEAYMRQEEPLNAG